MKNDDARLQIPGSLEPERFEPAVIRAELDRILNSDTFARSERSRELLQYVIERDLQGEADRLKGFAIALDVFDREDSFDPSTDAVVRVQAGRLRDLLDSYYSGEGAQDGIRISIPRGSYVPAYERMQPPAEQPAGEPGRPLPGPAGEAQGPAAVSGLVGQIVTQGRTGLRRKLYADMRLIWAALSLIIVLLGVNIWLLVDDGAGRADTVQIASMETQSDGESVTVSPSVYLPSVALMADIDGPLKAALEDAIPRFGSVVFRTDRSATVDEPLADFYLRAVPAGLSSMNIQLYHRESGILIATDQVPGGLDAEALNQHISRITSRFLPVGGVIYAFLETENRLNPLTRCLVLASAYFNKQDAQRHIDAYECSEALLAQGLNSALVFANLASLTVEVVTDHYSYPSGADFGTAIAYGRRAIELAPASSQAYRSLARALQAAGETEPALDVIREAHALNPFDLSIAASYADTLIATGDFEQAVTIMERTTQASPVHPTWWDFATFVAAFETGRYDLVSLSSRNLVGHERSHYCAARLIAADLEGDIALRDEMLAAITKGGDQFFRDPLGFYRRIMPEAAAERLVSALRDAGLPVAPPHEG